MATGAVLILPDSLIGNLAELLAQSYVRENVKGVANEYTAVAENVLRTKAAKVLDLDANGKRAFVVKKDFVDLFRRFGDDADIWLHTPPARLSRHMVRSGIN